MCWMLNVAVKGRPWEQGAHVATAYLTFHVQGHNISVILHFEVSLPRQVVESRQRQLLGAQGQHLYCRVRYRSEVLE